MGWTQIAWPAQTLPCQGLHGLAILFIVHVQTVSRIRGIPSVGLVGVSLLPLACAHLRVSSQQLRDHPRRQNHRVTRQTLDRRLKHVHARWTGGISDHERLNCLRIDQGLVGQHDQHSVEV